MADRVTLTDRLVELGASLADGSVVVLPGDIGFLRTHSSSSKWHLAHEGRRSAFCNVGGVGIGDSVDRVVLDMFGCAKCVDAFAGILEFLAPPKLEPGDTAHAWALDGPPLRNSTSETTSRFLDCPKCSDVILDVVNVRSGTLDVPRNIFSPLGLVWYARCPACGWTSPDRPSEWTLLEAVNEARS